MNETQKQCLDAIDVYGQAEFVLGLILGAFGLYFLDFLLGEFVNPWLRSVMHRNKAVRGIECHCDECEEKPRRGIDL